MELGKTLNLERAYDRVEELEEFLERFPESPFAECFRNAVNDPKKQIELYGG